MFAIHHPTSKDVLILIPGACEYVTFHGKKNFTDVTELGKLSSIIWVHLIVTKLLVRSAGDQRKKRCHHASRWGKGCVTQGHDPRDVGGL